MNRNTPLIKKVISSFLLCACISTLTPHSARSANIGDKINRSVDCILDNKIAFGAGGLGLYFAFRAWGARKIERNLRKQLRVALATLITPVEENSETTSHMVENQEAVDSFLNNTQLSDSFIAQLLAAAEEKAGNEDTRSPEISEKLAAQQRIVKELREEINDTEKEKTIFQMLALGLMGGAACKLYWDHQDEVGKAKRRAYQLGYSDYKKRLRSNLDPLLKLALGEKTPMQEVPTFTVQQSTTIFSPQEQAEGYLTVLDQIADHRPITQARKIQGTDITIYTFGTPPDDRTVEYTSRRVSSRRFPFTKEKREPIPLPPRFTINPLELASTSADNALLDVLEHGQWKQLTQAARKCITNITDPLTRKTLITKVGEIEAALEGSSQDVKNFRLQQAQQAAANKS